MNRPARLALALPALGLASLLLAPAEPAGGFSTLGFALGISQRDFRVFDNFADPRANDNQTPDPNFPGYLGATLAIWKSCVEWGSDLHGDGSGDPHQPGGLGSGGANFDAHFQGNATGIGGINDNVISAISSCGGGGTLAFTEAPSSNGWRIRICDDFDWNDGPGTNIGSDFDLQGVVCREYGHALGLGFTSTAGATMTAFLQANGVPHRSIAADDINGIQAIYGAKSGSKPGITDLTDNGDGTITITGQNFAASANEVRFTQKGPGGSGQPVVVSGVASNATGTQITVTVPGDAGSGDVLVRRGGASGHSSLSNAWPIDLASPPALTLASISPSSVPAVSPDGQALTLVGTGFTSVTGVSIDGIALSTFPVPEYVVQNDTTLVVSAIPYVTQVGSVDVEVTGPSSSASIPLQVDYNDPPALDLFDSDPDFLFNATGATVAMGSGPLDLFFLGVSPDLVPSVLPGLASFGIGNGFASFVFLGTYTVDLTQGYTLAHFPIPTALPTGTKLHFQAGVFAAAGGTFPLTATNIESGTILL